MTGPVTLPGPAAPEPHPYDGFVIEADTKDAFGLLLSRIGHRSPFPPKTIIRESGVSRPTVYRMLHPGDTSFQRSVDAVKRYAQACGMRPGQVDQVVTLWHRLNGTLVVAETDEVIVEAELVDPEAVVTTEPPTPSGVFATGGGNSVVVGGKIGGDVNITITQGPTRHGSIAAVATVLRHTLLLVLAAVVLSVIADAMQSPFDFADLDAGVIAIIEVIVLGLVMVVHIFTLARPRAAAALLLSLPPRPTSDGMPAGPLTPPAVRLLEGVLSWRPVAIISPAVIAGAIVSISTYVRNRELHDMSRKSFTYYYDSTNTAVVLSGLMVGVAVLVLVSIWATTTDTLAMRLTLRHFGTLLVIAGIVGILVAIFMTNMFKTPIGGFLVVALLVTAAIIHPCIGFVRAMVLVPALEEIRSGNTDLSRYAKWVKGNTPIGPSDPS